MNSSATMQPGAWSTGLCSCCRDSRECCRSLWCFPCISCEATERFGQCSCLPLLDVLANVFALGLLHPIAMSLRASVHQRYGIRGSVCNDCVLSTFCCCCVYCQVQQELDQRDLLHTSHYS